MTDAAPSLALNSNGDLWVFGYGSLVWKADFAFVEKIVGHVSGVSRRFWQASTDHRGVPEAPGRVVTLVEDKQGRTCGAAYRIAAGDVDNVVSHLDFRERGGYSLAKHLFVPIDSSISPFNVSVYIGTTSNPNWVGEQTLEEIAKIIAVAVGPSGPNVEYLFRLADWMREHAPEDNDPHLFELEVLVKKHIEQRGLREQQ